MNVDSLCRTELRFLRSQSRIKNLAVGRFVSFLAWREAAKDIRDLAGHFSRLGKRLKLPVNVCCISLFARPNSADDDNPLLFVDYVDHAVCREFVFPVEIQRRSLRKSVALRIHREFFRQHFLELILYAPVKSLYVTEGVAGERDGILGLGSAQDSPKTSSIV